LSVTRLAGGADPVIGWLRRGGPGVRAVYEAGPTGFGLARAARDAGIDLRVVTPGLVPKRPTDRVKTDRRDAVRLARLLAAGELSFARVPTVAEEQFRDLVRARDDVRSDLMRARHRLSNLSPWRGGSATPCQQQKPVRSKPISASDCRDDSTCDPRLRSPHDIVECHCPTAASRQSFVTARVTPHAPPVVRSRGAVRRRAHRR
jgi:hypothetical protein